MRGSIFVEKKFLDFIVTNNCPGVFGFINYAEKKIWISFSENISEAVIRNIKLAVTRNHRIKKIEDWDLCVFAKTKTKQEAKNQFRSVCQSYRGKGLEIINKEFKYRIWGSIEPSFKSPTDYLYYIWAGTKRSKLGVLGIFTNALEGEKYLKAFKAGKVTEFPPESKRLVLEYKKFDPAKDEFNRMFNDEAI